VSTKKTEEEGEVSDLDQKGKGPFALGRACGLITQGRKEVPEGDTKKKKRSEGRPREKVGGELSKVLEWSGNILKQKRRDVI